MQKITPHLWFDKEAKEAAAFYTSVFPNSRITHSSVLDDTPSGSVDVVNFELAGMAFASISAGPYFKINPSISFFLNFDPSKNAKAREDLDAMWKKLAEGGKALMALDKYPFSDRYGWIQDKFGVSWQLILTDPKGEERPFIVPSLLFVGPVAGKAEEATDFYLSVFSARGGSASGGKNAKRGAIVRYPAGSEHDKEGTLMFTDFMLENQWFAAMDSAHPLHDFGFNEAVSLLVSCKDQAEIDYYWEKLSAIPESEQCGWLKDKYGVSWQIVPYEMDEMMTKGSKEQIARVTKAFLKMKKFDLEALRRAYEGK